MADENQKPDPQNRQQIDRQAKVMQAMRDFFKKHKATTPETAKGKAQRSPGLFDNDS
jgi:hypothetical protein